MYYILDDLGYIEEVSSHYIERDSKTCFEYTGAIPTGYETLDDWVLNANIRAYKITDGNLVYDADRNATLQAEWKKEFSPYNYSINEQIVGTWIDGKPIYRKVINYVLGDANTWGYIAHNIDNMNVCVNQKTMFYYNSRYYDAPNDFLIEVTVSQTNVGYYCINNFKGYGGFTVLEYTKTTD